MLAYKVYRNNEQLCLAGVGQFGVLTACVTWVGRRPETLGGPTADAVLPEHELTLQVGGLRSDDPGRALHMRWVDVDLQVGDEIRIQVVEAPRSDTPTTEHPQDPAEDLEAKKTYARQLAKELGWTIQEA